MAVRWDVYVLERSRDHQRGGPWLEWRYYASADSAEKAEKLARALRDKHGIRVRVDPPAGLSPAQNPPRWHRFGPYRRWTAEPPHSLLVQRKDDWGRWIDYVVWDPVLLGWVDARDLRTEVFRPFGDDRVLRAVGRKVPGWSVGPPS